MTTSQPSQPCSPGVHASNASQAAARERRRLERRARPLISEPLSRRRDRRAEERRTSPRREAALDVREPGMMTRSCVGDLSVEGASFITLAPPTGDVIELMFCVPTYVGPIVALGAVISRVGTDKGTQVGVVFTDLEVEAQLAIAQWFDDASPISRP